MNTIRRPRLSLELLDDRIVPAIGVTQTPSGVLTVTGFPASNNLVVTQLSTNNINVTDGAISYGPFTAPAGINISLTRFNQAVLVDLGDFTYSGNVTIDLGLGSTAAGIREVSVFDGNGATGGLGTIQGNVTIRNGNGTEYISIGRPAATAGVDLPAQVNGNVFVTTKYNAGPDRFELVPGAVVQSSIYLTNVDRASIGLFAPGAVPATVGGSVIDSNPAPTSTFIVDTFAAIQGNLAVISSAGSIQNSSVNVGNGSTIGSLTTVLTNGNDAVTIGSGVVAQPAPVIFGDANLNFGTGNDVLKIPVNSNLTAAQIRGNFNANLGQGDNTVQFDPPAFVGGSLSITGGNGNDRIGTIAPIGGQGFPFGGTIIGNMSISLGNGDNFVDFTGKVLGNQIHIQTEGGNDTVTMGDSAFAPGAALSVYLGAGDDQMIMNSANFYSAYLDGGAGGSDQLTSTIIFPFNTTLLNFEL